MIVQANSIHIPLAPKSIHMSVSSPPYWGQRDYGLPGTLWGNVRYRPMYGLPEISIDPWVGCLGLEKTPEAFVAHIVAIYREVWRVLRDDGTCWINFGDTYSRNPQKGDNSGYGMHNWIDDQLPGHSRPAPLPEKNLIGIPWRVAFALQADGWYLRSDIIWEKVNCMPESVRDRPTKAHEYVFLLAKSERYYYDAEAVKEPPAGSGIKSNESFNKAITQYVKVPGGRNRRTVWTIPTQGFSGAHFATFPPELVAPCILAGSRPGDIVLDHFCGSGTTGEVCFETGRRFVGLDLSRTYLRDFALPRAERKQTNESMSTLPMFDNLSI